MEKISSLQNPLIKKLTNLHQKKYRQAAQQFLIDGWHLLNEALSNQSVISIFVVDELNVVNQLQSLSIKGIKIYLVNQAIINKLSMAKTPQPVVALCQMPQHQITNHEQVIVLDFIQDPNNLGAIIRNMVAFGLDNLVLSLNSVDCFNEKVINASQGAIFKIAINYTDLKTYLPKLKADGFSLFGTFLHQQPTKTLEKIKFPAKTAIIFGNEGSGISKDWCNLVDDNFIIKTTNQVESLNVAMSVGIVSYCLFVNNIIEFRQ